MEHRWGQRIDVDVNVQLKTKGGLAGYGRVCNVSVSGAFVRTTVPVPVLSRVQVVIPAGKQDPRVIAAYDGQVIRRTDEGLAIEWRIVSPEILRTMAALSPATKARTAEAAAYG